MRNYKKYRSTVIHCFISFLAGKENREDLIKNLLFIESLISKGKTTDKNIWFRFFEHDPIATTIIDLENAMQFTQDNNWINECMQIAIDNPKGFQIYYS